MVDFKQIKDAQEAWQIAVSAGDAAAEQAAQAAVTGCRSALIALTENLKQMNYPVKTYFTPCSEGFDPRVTAIEEATGKSIPPILKLFWRTVGGVSLVDLEDYAHKSFWSERNIHNSELGCSDGLYVQGLSEDWSRALVKSFFNAQEYHKRSGWAESPFFIFLSPDGFHKDCFSGGDDYEVLSGNSWNPPLENFTWLGPKRPETAPPDPCDFLSYLRTTILECAGFPGLYGVPEFEPIRERLLADVPLF